MSTPPRRITFTRALRVAGYNWPLYTAAGTVVIIGLVVLCLPGVPPTVRWLCAAAVAIAAWFGCASFLAFHWMFDRSELLDGQWLAQELPQAPRRWVQINVGLEETTLPMGRVFPEAEGKMLDLYNASVMTEPAVTRARQQGAGATAVAVQPDSLPVEDGWADVVVVMLAAHEIRDDGKRQRFFQELCRIVAPDGKLIVVEHLRDLAAALAFGPGMFHFYPRTEWLRLGNTAGLDVQRERRITPLVRAFIYASRKC
jgi:SAM-dependent methyltransferase